MKIKSPPFYTYPLILAVLFFVGLRFYNLLYNSLFLDEAIYIVLGKNILEGSLQNALPLNWVGGAPFLFPLLSAYFYNLFGIVGPRLLTVLLGIISLYFMYRIGLNLFYTKNKELSFLTGLISALLLSISSIHLWLSRLAIYDMLAFVFLVIGFALALDGFRTRSTKLYIISSLLLILSFFAKYSVLIIFPALAIIVFVKVYFYKKEELKNAFFWIINIILGASIYIVLFFDQFIIFLTQHAMGAATTDGTQILLNFWGVTGIWLVLSFVALVWNLIYKNYFSLLLFTLSFIPIIVNIVIMSNNTVEQNALFSLLLLIPLSAYILAFITLNRKVIGVTSVLIIVAAIAYFFSFSQLYSLTHFWPNTNEAMSVMRENASSESRVLSESGDVAVIALEGIVPSNRIVSPFFFEYEQYEGEQAYIQALQDQYFDLVQFEYATGNFHQSLTQYLNAGYQPIYEDNNIIIYERL